jgi:hypothetical protein
MEVPPPLQTSQRVTSSYRGVRDILVGIMPRSPSKVTETHGAPLVLISRSGSPTLLE